MQGSKVDVVREGGFGKPALVLLVESDPGTRSALSRLLMQNLADATVADVADAQAAIDLLRAATPDLVIIGTPLVDRDTADLCREITSAPAMGDVPLILLTDAGDEEAQNRARSSNADVWLLKPVPPTELLARSRALLRFRKRIRELVERERELSLRLDWNRYLVHDLRSPLTAALLALDMIQRTAEQPDRATMLARAAYNLRVTAAMLQDLLDIDRFHRNRVRLRKSRFEAKTLVEKVVAELGLRAEQRETPIEIHTTAEPIPLVADLTLIERVLRNLLENSLRYAPSRTPIGIHFRRQGPAHVRIAVTNHGPAVPLAVREKLFQPFVRLADDTEIQGAGLGLAFCRLAIEAHGGRIWIEDPDGGGVQFVFSLPTRSDN